jgi:outer membrane protein assembly factor BamA
MSGKAKLALVLCLFGFVSALSPLPSAAQGAKKAQVPDQTLTTYGRRLLAIPIVYYTPETSLAFGAGGVYTFRLGVHKEQTRPTSLWMFLVYTLKKQLQAKFMPEVYFANNDYVLNGTLKFEKFPQKFFGVGNDTEEAAEELYTPQTIGFDVAFQRRFLSHLYAGVKYEFESTKILESAPDGLLASGELLGSRGGVVSGVGLNLSWDSRDNNLYPRRGQYFRFFTGFYGRVLGSDFNFTSSELDLRSYFPVRRSVLALKAYLGTRGGSPPFYRLSLLGGESLLRGYYLGRFRDKGMLLLQAEYRLPLWKRFGLVGFTGLGDVFETLSGLRVNQLKHSLGAGLRYRIDAKEGTNLRMDFAWGKKSFGLYFTATESF